ncbi:MAG: alpha-L-fucosidase [Firmicutes bacterium]|nr:alpha-L-fucosidase [Bacillota bacterium]MCM1401555.1 alpha-L-fucosidase [Bacteroides sp.]MCM1477249.1 alpha-L-fucosidase [Bacteroides sp.]
MKKLFLTAIAIASLFTPAKAEYVPTAENLEARKEFADNGFGIFLHWGIYSMFAQGEWYLNSGISAKEYSKVASAFYPAQFNAASWVKAIKESGAKYICFTSRHHDGFSMWDTDQSDYNVVDATPFGRDVIKELADECHKQGIKLHLYYSHIDWGRDDYPKGRTGLKTGCDDSKQDWPGYYDFMNRQLTELLTKYGEIGAIWFDGHWDHDQDSIPFNWQLPEQYALIHKLQPRCLVGNNHHITPHEGEDIQIFERDLPGENTAGLSGQDISRLPLETCQTMNGMWGYKVADQNYKDATTLIHYLVKAAGMGANLLLNIGPQPNGELPETALSRLKEIGEWMNVYGETFYGTTAGDFPAQEWGTSTRKGKKLFVHLLTPESASINIPTSAKVKKAVGFIDRKPVKFTKEKDGSVTLHLSEIPVNTIDHVIELETI